MKKMTTPNALNKLFLLTTMPSVIRIQTNNKITKNMMKKNLSMMLMVLVAFIAFTMQSCSKYDDPTPSPTEDLADYTLFVYGHAGGRMDWIIEDVYEKVKPLLTDNKKLRVLFFYKYGHKDQDFDFSGRYANEDEVVRFELTSKTDLSKLRTDACFEEKSQYQLYDPQNLTEQLNWVAKTAPAKNYIFMLYGHGAGFNAKDDFAVLPGPACPGLRGVRGGLPDRRGGRLSGPQAQPGDALRQAHGSAGGQADAAEHDALPGQHRPHYHRVCQGLAGDHRHRGSHKADVCKYGTLEKRLYRTYGRHQWRPVLHENDGH